MISPRSSSDSVTGFPFILLACDAFSTSTATSSSRTPYVRSGGTSSFRHSAGVRKAFPKSRFANSTAGDAESGESSRGSEGPFDFRS